MQVTSWTVLGRSKPFLIVRANIFEVSVTCSMTVTGYMCLQMIRLFLWWWLSQLKKHDVASKQVRKHLISKVPSTIISTRSRLLCQKHQTQWEKYPPNAYFFSASSMIGVEQTDNIKMKWNLTGMVAILWKWPCFSKDRSLPLGAGRYKTAWQHSMWMPVSNISIANIFCYCCVSLSGLQSVPFKYDEYESKNI